MSKVDEYYFFAFAIIQLLWFEQISPFRLKDFPVSNCFRLFCFKIYINKLYFQTFLLQAKKRTQVSRHKWYIWPKFDTKHQKTTQNVKKKTQKCLNWLKIQGKNQNHARIQDFSHIHMNPAFNCWCIHSTIPLDWEAEGFVVGENEELPPFQYEPEVADRGVDSQQLPVKGL